MMLPVVLDLDDELTRTAIREAGHAVVHWYCGSRVTGIRVSPDGTGRVTMVPASGATRFTRAVAALSGLAAEEVFGDCSRDGGGRDLKKARELLGAAYADAWLVALGLARRFEPIIDALARQLIRRRELDESEFLALAGPSPRWERPDPALAERR
jgi:hypothetical protein